MKRYIYKYVFNDKEYYWSVDDNNNDILVLNNRHAKLFTEKEVSILDLDNSFSVGDELWVEELNDYITLETKLIKVRIS